MGIGWLTTNENFYVAADKVTLTGEYSNGEIPQSSLNDDALQNVLVFKDVQVPGAQNNKAHVINLKRIKELVDAGYLPVNNKSLTEWVKVGKSDGYFSDWIVTLTEAQRQDENPVKPSLHVLCEDLTAQDANDFDFNDVVFDVFYVDASTVTIKVLAAGGTLPLRLCGRNDWEVHTLYNVDVKCMVNTGKKYHVATSPYTQQEGLGVKELTYTGFNGWSDDQNTFASQVNEKIKIEVQREENGEWVELTAPVGGPTAKIATPVNIYMKDADWYPEEYRWAWEKQNIGKSFSNWVSNPGSVWYTTK